VERRDRGTGKELSEQTEEFLGGETSSKEETGKQRGDLESRDRQSDPAEGARAILAAKRKCRGDRGEARHAEQGDR